MKIVREGNLDHRLFEGRCLNCGCVVTDVDPANVQSSEDPREPGWYIKCPTAKCDRLLWLKPKSRSVLDGIPIKET